MTALEPKNSLYTSLAEMLAEETLSDLLNQPVSQVNCRAFELTNGFSSNLLFHVEAGGQKLVLKRLRPAKDWLAKISNDDRCRSIRVWQYGLLDRLQPHIHHGILTACRDGEDYAILMQDLTPGLLNGRPLSPKTISRMLDALARMHAIFWEDEILQDQALGLANMDAKLAHIWQFQPEDYQDAPHILDIMQKGRAAQLELVEPDVRAALLSLIDDPLPLIHFLDRLPTTLVHSDFRQDNLAFFAGSQELFAYDWQMAARAPMTADVCWFVGSLIGEIDSHDMYYAYYRQQLAGTLGGRFDPHSWQAMLEVGCLVEVLTKGTWHAFFAAYNEDEPFRAQMRRSVDSYNEIVRRGVRWL